MAKVVLVIQDEEVSVQYSDPNVTPIIIDLDADELYCYDNKYICEVRAVNDDGTVDLKCVDLMDDAVPDGELGRVFNSVPAEVIWFLENGVGDPDSDDFGED